VQAEGIEAQGVFGAVFMPLVIGERLDGLEGILVALGIALVYNELSRLLWLERTDVGRFQDGAQGAFGRYGMCADKLPIPG
jgi:hypothetical protein